jgi:hypothetical protein
MQSITISKLRILDDFPDPTYPTVTVAGEQDRAHEEAPKKVDT